MCRFSLHLRDRLYISSLDILQCLHDQFATDDSQAIEKFSAGGLLTDLNFCLL